jgi:class 3 adenylate cyclase
MAKQPAKGGGSPIPKIEIDLDLPPKQGEALLKTLQERFEKNMHRHEGLEWAKIQAKLEAQLEKLRSLYAMESTGGEPDVVGFDEKTGETIFYDCAEQSPHGRRSICYDGKAQAEREKKGVHPAGNAVDLAAAMGIELLTEEEYRALQELEEIDTKTESWVKTPEDIRKLGGAIFCDRRFGRVFTFHNSAPSFYAGRGFRGSLRV